MNRHQLRYFLLAILFPLFLASCGDDDDDDVSPNVSLLTAGEWNGQAIYFGGDDVTQQIIEDFDFDITKATSTFKRDGTYTDTYEGDVAVEGKWEFQDNERTIVFDKDTNDEYSVSVTKLDEDELVYIQDGLEFRFTR